MPVKGTLSNVNAGGKPLGCICMAAVSSVSTQRAKWVSMKRATSLTSWPGGHSVQLFLEESQVDGNAPPGRDLSWRNSPSTSHLEGSRHFFTEGRCTLLTSMQPAVFEDFELVSESTHGVWYHTFLLHSEGKQSLPPPNMPFGIVFLSWLFLRN